jgi:hypothetical protein
MAVAPQPSGRTLDRVVDEVLKSSPLGSDWSTAAHMLAPQRPLLAGNPFARLFVSEFGNRAVSAIGNESKSLGAVGVFAANALGMLLDHDAGKRILGQTLRPNVKKLIVYHGDRGLRSSILILDPGLDESDAPLLPKIDWSPDLVDLARHLFDQSRIRTALPTLNSDDAIEALWIGRPRIVIAAAPKMIDTCVRRPAGTVTCGAKNSAVGAYAHDSAGNPGVTVCYHGTGGTGTELSIDHVMRKVSLESQALDTCFVPIGNHELPVVPPPLFAARGLLAARAPGAQERHTFWSEASKALVEARITATDFGLPQPTPQRQLCVYTDPVTNYGDSGGALLNDDDQLVGFSFQRTPFDRPLQYSTWIWANSAFDELKLKPILDTITN